MLTAIIVTGVAFSVIVFSVGTPHGRAPATSLRVGLSWLWPTRVSVLGR